MFARCSVFAVALVLVAVCSGLVQVSAQSSPGQRVLPVGASGFDSPYQTDSAPPCDEVCSEQVDCNEPCWYTTCGEWGVYGSCDSCATACGVGVPCDTSCIDDEMLTSCGATEYECGMPSNCASICQTPVGCGVVCWNGESYSTCLAEHYDCGPCPERQIHPVGVWEEVTERDAFGNPVLVDCYASWAWFDVDQCENDPPVFLSCDWPTLLGGNEQPETCCDLYAFGYGGCGAGWGC